MPTSSDMPLITVGIPFYNNEKTLAYAITSVLMQSYQNLEILLVDDGSRDGSLEIAKKFAKQDSRIQVITDGTNKGLIARLNQIIQLAKGDYIARMDADDLIAPARLEKQYDVFLKTPTVEVVGTGLISLTNDLGPVGKRCCQKTYPNIYQVFKNGDGILHPTIMASKAWFKKNLYLEGFDRAEDRELFTRTLNRNNYYIVTEPLYYYLDVQNMTLKKYLMSYQSERKSLLKNWRGKLKSSQMIYLYGRSYLKSLVIRGYFLLNKQENLFKAKNDPLSNKELAQIKEIISNIKTNSSTKA